MLKCLRVASTGLTHDASPGHWAAIGEAEGRRNVNALSLLTC